MQLVVKTMRCCGGLCVSFDGVGLFLLGMVLASAAGAFSYVCVTVYICTPPCSRPSVGA